MSPDPDAPLELALPPPRSAPPFGRGELRAVFARPYRALDLVFSERERLVATVAQGREPALLVLVLLFASALFALPYGAVLGWERFWRVAATFLGALAVCFPSLHVFSAYVGLRLRTEQNLALALVITAAASLFTFGFFPILWYLRATMLPDGLVTPAHLSVAMLVASLAAGIAHLYRCLPSMRGQGVYVLVSLGWQVLFVFITHRMAVLLEVW